jgi:hypothetical protein
VISRYRRLPPSQRSTLDLVVAQMWAPGDLRVQPDEVVVHPAEIAEISGWSIRQVQRALRALSGEPGGIACLSTCTRSHGILRDHTHGSYPPPGRLLTLQPWSEWWWPPGALLAVERAVAAMPAPTPLAPAQRLARLFVRHLLWAGHVTGAEAPDVPGDPLFERWARELEATHGTEEDLRHVLGYLLHSGDTFWADHLRGPEAARILHMHWEGLLLRARKEAAWSPSS